MEVCYSSNRNRIINNRITLNLVICDSLAWWDGVGSMFKMEGTYVYLRLVHADVWQKPTQ